MQQINLLSHKSKLVKFGRDMFMNRNLVLRLEAINSDKPI